MRTTDFPSGQALAAAKPVYEYLPGFSGDISGCRRFEELPQAAKAGLGLALPSVGTASGGK